MVKHLFMPQKTWGQIFYWPLLIALLSSTGLVTALLCDRRLLEWVSNAAVALPVVVAAYFYWFSKTYSKSTV